MDYRQTIDYLFAKLPMFSRIGPPAFKKDLTNAIALCEALGNPHKKFRSIHVAGTNGKGSVCHMLAAIFQAAGYRTGLYTSPHFKDFRERIKINGELVREEYVVQFVEQMKSMIEGIEPSFFEITVAMAFDYFAQQQVDIAIVEVGLGGRFDSTNIISPELSVITNIGWDHMNMLGDTLEKIAFEKAGIIKPGVPVVIGETDQAIAHVFIEIALRNGAPVSFADQARTVADWHWNKHELIIEVAEPHKTDHDVYRLDLPGIYQTKNLLTVLECIHQSNRSGWEISNEAIKKALKQVKKQTGLHGRWETIHEHPQLILDVAHNLEGMKQLAAQIELSDFEQLHIVVGIVKDKNVKEILSPLPKHAQYYFTKAQIPRALPEDTLRDLGKELGLNGYPYSNVNEALEAALLKAGKKDMILVCGSLFVAGEVDKNKFKPNPVNLAVNA